MPIIGESIGRPRRLWRSRMHACRSDSLGSQGWDHNVFGLSYSFTIRSKPRPLAFAATGLRRRRPPAGCSSMQASIAAHYLDSSASGSARQHNGNVYNTSTTHYTIRQGRSDETLNDQALYKAFAKAAAEGQTRRVDVLAHRGADADYDDGTGTTLTSCLL